MATEIAVGVVRPGLALRGADDGNSSDPALLAVTLVAALEEALLAARQLLGALETADGCRTGTPPHAPAPPRATVDGAAGRRYPAGAGGLSRREVEVLRLLAIGHSNRQIAQALSLSPRTVQRHVANVYRKIGAHCRAEATAHALRYGLG